MKIDPYIINKIKDSVGELLQTYSSEIRIVVAEEGSISIALPVKIAQTVSKGLAASIGISFVKSQVKDQIGFIVGENKHGQLGPIDNQKKIPFQEEKERGPDEN